MIYEFSLITSIFGFLTGFFGTTFFTKNHHINFKADLIITILSFILMILFSIL